LQETKLAGPHPLPDPARYLPPPAVEPAHHLVQEAVKRLLAAERPLILMGRVTRSEADWAQRVALAESLGAVVLTDMKLAAAFPTEHPLYGAPAATHTTPATAELIRQADVVLSLNWVDLGGLFKVVWQKEKVASSVIRVSIDQYAHNGWIMDYHVLPPSDLYLLAESDPTVAALNAEIARQGGRKRLSWPGRKKPTPAAAPATDDAGTITVPLMAATLRRLLDGRKTSLIRHPLSWAGHLWTIRHPLDFLGSDGGGGVGSGPGTSVGAALALRSTDRLALTILGDGDFMMGSNAIWTAVHYRIPLMVVIANNRSFYNDEVHQERVARERDRPVANKWIGQQVIDPDIDVAAIARAQGAQGFGPVKKLAELEGNLEGAIAAVTAGQVAVVDVRVAPGYDPLTMSAMTRA